MGQIKNIKLHIVTDIKVLHLTKTTTTMPGGVTVKDVNPQDFVRAFAAHLKKSKLKVPEMVEIVKTSKAHELGPTDPDWFYVRTASVARKVLQSLEGIKLITKDVNGGRTIAPTGRRDMDRIAGQCVSQAIEG